MVGVMYFFLTPDYAVQGDELAHFSAAFGSMPV
jgi:hypothetical protein